ncbi:hypothetical protein GYA54_02895 [Candidatus Kuenenbacteria bacterium]|nr:hypothetical protein [Candidatus Kuenenbacteria bacterium]
MPIYKYIRFILIAAPIIFLGFLIYKDLVPSGRLITNYDFCDLNPFASSWSPHGRVLAIEKIKMGGDKYCQQKMVIDPVYFDIRLPQRFNEARLTVWYQKKSETKLQIGPAIDLSAWQWQLKDINYIRTENNWQVGVADYNIQSSKLDNNRLRFLVSSPNMDTSRQEIIFKKIEIEFIKKPITAWPDFIERAKEFILFSRLKIIFQ